MQKTVQSSKPTFPTFVPKTERLQKLAIKFPQVINKLELMFDKPTIIYIDFANVIPWSNRLKWNVDVKRLKQLFDSFPNIKKVRFYYGDLSGDPHSQMILAEARKSNYDVKTKPVKIIRQSINVSSIDMQSPSLLRQFISKPLLDNLSIQDIQYLNNRFKVLNTTGVYELRDKKCNFDVEIRGHMTEDSKDQTIEKFALWSGDCDFEEPVKELKNAGKGVIVFGTRGVVSHELANSGAFIYEVYSLKNFICFPKQLDLAV